MCQKEQALHVYVCHKLLQKWIYLTLVRSIILCFQKLIFAFFGIQSKFYTNYSGPAFP